MKKAYFIIMFLIFCMSLKAQPWFEEPMTICKNTFSNIQECIETNDGIMMVYTDVLKPQTKLMLQKIDTYGQNVWETPICLDSTYFDLIEVKIIKNSDNDFFVVWVIPNYSDINPTLIPNTIFSMKFDLSGQLLLPKTQISQGSYNHRTINIVPDLNGGYYISFLQSNYNAAYNGLLKVRHINSENQSDWNNETVTVSNVQLMKHLTLFPDQSNQATFFYSEKSGPWNNEYIYASKISASGIISNSTVVDTSRYNSNLGPFNSGRYAIIQLNENQFIISSGVYDSLNSVKSFDQNFNLQWQIKYPINTQSQSRLIALDSDCFIIIYRESDSLIRVKKVNLNGETILSTEYPTQGYQSEINTVHKYSSHLFIKQVDKFSNNPTSISPIINYKRNIINLNLNTWSIDTDSALNLNTNSFPKLDFFSSEKLYSFQKNDDLQKDYIFKLFRITTNYLIFSKNNFFSHDYYSIDEYKSTPYQDKNLFRFTSQPGFYLVDSQGNSSQFSANETLPEGYKVNQISEVFNDKLFVTYNTTITNAFDESYTMSRASLISQNGEIISASVFNHSKSDIQVEDNICWAALQGTHLIGNSSIDYINLYKFTNTAPSISASTEIISGYNLIGIKGRYLFIHNQSILKVLKFNDNAQISENWNTNGTVISYSCPSNSQLKILWTEETTNGLLIIWQEYNLGYGYIKSVYLNPDDGTLISQNPEIIHEIYSRIKECKVIKHNNRYFISIASYDDYGHYLIVNAYHMNNSIFTLDWEKDLTEFYYDNKDIYYYDMHLINNKLLIALARGQGIYIRTLSLSGNFDQYPYGLFLYRSNSFCNSIRIIPSDETHAFINWNNGYEELYCQYIDVSDFLNTNDHLTPQIQTFSINSYPNPFNHTTNINFSLKKENKVKVNIFNLKGQKINTIISEKKSDGSHNIIWNGKDKNNVECPSGIYFIKVEAEGMNQAKKILKLR